MQILKPILPIVVLFSLIYADEDSNKTSTSLNRDGYMPRLITPESQKSGIYGGLALSAALVSYQTQIDNDNTALDLSLITGYNFNSYLAAESRATISIANDNSIDYQKLSIFLKPKYQVSKGLNLYSLIGFGKVKAKSVGSDETQSSKSSMQFGFGADFELEDNFKVFADYTYLGKDTNAKYKNEPATLKSSALTAGISYDF